MLLALSKNIDWIEYLIIIQMVDNYAESDGLILAR